MNPPGYVYAVSYVLCSFLLFFCVKSSWRDIERGGSAIVFPALLFIWMIVSDGIPQLFFWPCMALTILLIFGLFSYGFGLKAGTAIYYTAQAFIMGEGTASIEWQMVYYLKEMEGITQKYQIIAGSCLYSIILLCLYWIEKKVHKRDLELELTRKEIISVCAIAFVVFFMSNLSYVSIETPFTVNIPSQIFNIHTWVDIGGIAILIAYHVMASEVQARLEMENLQNIMQMQYNNYKISQQSMDIVNQKYHDLKHQIEMLRVEFDSQEGMEFLEQMQNEIEVFETLNKTGNRILDAILTSKSIYCQSHGIKLNTVADGTALDFMDKMDISALFGNALDNAIECEKKIEDPEKRLIYLTLVRQKDFLRIRIENYCTENVEFENGIPKTSKNDKRYHGFGVKSMRSIVKKYDGSINMEMKEQWFEVRILIPLPKSEITR